MAVKFTEVMKSKNFWSKMQRNAFGLTPSSILSGSKSGWGSLEQFEKSVFEKPNLFWLEGTWKRVAKSNHAVSFPPPIDSGLFCPDRLCLNIKWNISNQWFLKNTLTSEAGPCMKFIICFRRWTHPVFFHKNMHGMENDGIMRINNIKKTLINWQVISMIKFLDIVCHF